MPWLQNRVNLQPYLFDAPPSPSHVPANTRSAGAFGRQALAALVTGRDFGVLSQALDPDVQLVHATDHMVPRLRGKPVLATVFDAIPLAHPEWVSYRFKALKNELWRRTVRWADHIVTISEFSRTQIATHFRIPPARITVIPLGVSPSWLEPLAPTSWQAVQARHALPPHYVVCVGTLQPRKNLGRLLSAHAALPAPLQRQYPLLVVGKPGWACEADLARMASGQLPHVRWLGHLPDADVQAVVKRASALVFPSLSEGFGLPVLEGFAAGVPVVASNATSIPEVAGDAAVLVDPWQVDALADGLQRVLDNAHLAHQCVARGAQRVQAFTWQASAERTLAVYRSLC